MTHILVAYATRLGSTIEVADLIGLVLSNRTGTVDVKSVDKVADLSQYDAVVIGSAIRVGKWLPNAFEFIERNRSALKNLPVAYFTVCMTLKEDTEETRTIVSNYHAMLFDRFPEIEPISLGMFAGAFDPQSAPTLVQLLARTAGIGSGDYRDWEAIRDWAEELGDFLTENVKFARQEA